MTSADPNFFPRRPAARLLAVAAALGALLGIGQAAAQDYRFGWDPRTGDVWVDTWLDDVNRYGGRYQDAFVDELVRYHGAPRDLVLDLLVERGWAPGDVYYACAIARIIGRPCRYVADEWARDHGEGWGALAQRLGIKPGSDEFMRLKRGFVPTYDRWGRPIRVDDDLARFYPQRERMRGNDRPGANGRGEPHRAGHADERGRGRAAAGNGRGRAESVRGNNGNRGHRGNADNGRGAERGQAGDRGRGTGKDD